MQEELKSNTVIPIYKKGYKQNVENYSGITLLNTCYKLQCKILNEKLEAQRGKFLLECHNGFREGTSCINPFFSIKLLTEKR